MERYKMTLSNSKIYYEVALDPDAKEVSVGTGKSNNIRLSANLFFEEFHFSLENQENSWSLVCGDNNYISSDGILKLTTKQLCHGDLLKLKYKSSNQEIISVSFTLDFEYETKDYELMIDIGGLRTFTIGGANNCDIQLDDPLIGNDTITVTNTQGNLQVRDNNTQYGVYLNGVRNQQEEISVRDYDFFSVIGYSFYYKYGKIYTSKSSSLRIETLPHTIEAESDGRFAYPHFNRNTRIRVLVPSEEISILDPPEKPKKPEQNIALTLMPALGMLAITVLVRGQMMGGNMSFIIFSACSVGMGIITSIVTFVNSRKKYKSEIENREQKYNAYITEKRRVITEKRQHERAVLEEVFAAPEKELTMVKTFSSDLFDRRPEDDDFLHLRIGTGPTKSSQPVAYKEQEVLEVEDEMTTLPSAVAAEFEFLPAAPTVLDGANAGAIGIVGNPKRLYEMLKNLLLDISARQYYTDVNVFLMMDEKQAGPLAWVRLLPHLENDRLGVRNIVCDDESRNTLFEYLYKELSNRQAAKVKTPHIVIFVYNDVGIKSHPLSNFIDDASEYGVTFLFFEKRKEQLPLGCSKVILLSGNDTGGQIVSSSDDTEEMNFAFDPIDDVDASYFVQKLAPVYCDEISLESSLTKSISFYQTMDILSVTDLNLEQRWQTSQIHKSMAAPLGVNSKNEIVALDLHEKYHGPHGLVAGTTGSGKSEILQSYIISMATLFHPYEVGFVIIDFKGGGMVNQFKELPHLVGAITNIDGREIDRSLLSIKAELRKRQELFSKADVNHIDAYIQLFKKGQVDIPLPHLILIVDEFAELKMDQPEFMKELISAARIGRSLGVHLILATQKPSGVVDAQIWSNSKFKLCLKVQNKEDSNEVLKSPLAAEIREPGRAYLQVGNNEIFELFQSAYSGAPAVTNVDAKKKFKINEVNLWGKKKTIYEQKPDKGSDDAMTQLDAVVDYVVQFSNSKGIKRLPGICLPPLRENIPYSEAQPLAKASSSVQVALGVYDDPNNQLQQQVNLDLLSGNTFVVGASQFGKTAFLQLVLRGLAGRYTPEEASVYIMDFASMALKVFDEMPHVGGVITAGDDVKLKTFFRMMSREIVQRKEKFSKMGITSFSSYLDAGYKDLPAIVIMLDNITAFRELYEDFDDAFLGFCREGLAVGISIIVTTAQTRSIGYKYMSNFANPIALYCNQKDEYSNLFERCRMEPKSVPGRALISMRKEIFEYQNYLAFEGEKEIERVEDIKKFTAATAARCQGMQARRIPEIPDVLTMDFLRENFEAPPPYVVYAGMNFDTVDVVPFNLARMGYFAISGREKSGKTNFIRYVMHCLEQANNTHPAQVFLYDSYDRQLESLKTAPLVEEYATELEAVEARLEALDAECTRRKEEIKQNGIKAQNTMPLLFVVIQNDRFYEAGGLSKNGAEIIKKLLKAAKEVKLCFVYSNLENAAVGYSGPEALKILKETKSLLFFDDLASLKIMDVGLSDLRAFKKPIDVGDAFYMDDRSTVKIKTPHIPEAEASPEM